MAIEIIDIDPEVDKSGEAVGTLPHSLSSDEVEELVKLLAGFTGWKWDWKWDQPEFGVRRSRILMCLRGLSVPLGTMKTVMNIGALKPKRSCNRHVDCDQAPFGEPHCNVVNCMLCFPKQGRIY